MGYTLLAPRNERVIIMELKTARLVLRPWRESDAESLFEYASDPRIGPAAGWQVHKDVQNSLEIIRTILSAPETYAVCLRGEDRAIGAVGLSVGEQSDLTEHPEEGEIGYWIGVPFWGMGLIPEAVRELQRHAFEDLNLNVLWCSRFDENDKSRRVQEKCGFTYRYTKKIYVPALKTEKILHVSRLTREEWKGERK